MSDTELYPNIDNQNENTPNDAEMMVADQPISWEASEYVHHEKDIVWFGVFGFASVVVMLGMYLILQDILSIVVVALMAIALIVYANRPPRVLTYSVGDEGLQIGERKYTYESFKSFSIVDDMAVESIILNPLQRLMPPLTIYFAKEDGENIVEMLSHYLPLKEHNPDFIDRFAQRIRF